MNNPLKQTILFYRGFQVFFSLLFWIPIFYAVQKLLGLSDPEIFGIQSIYYLAFIVFEIPTGFIADKIGHRKTMAGGALFLFGANLLPVLMPNYVGFLVHFLLIATARSLVSGSASAYFYDYLKKNEGEDYYKKEEGRARSWSLIARVITWPLAGYLVAVDPTLPYLATALTSLLAVLFAFLLPPDASNWIKTTPNRTVQTELSNIMSIFRSRPILFLLMLQGAGIFVLQRLLMVQLFGPLLKQQAISLVYLGTIMSSMTLIEAFGAMHSYRIKKWVQDYVAIFGFTLLIALSFWLMTLSAYLSISGLAIFSGACGLAFPIQRQLLNDHIDKSEYRATILSIESILDRLICALTTYLIGPLIATGKLDKLLYVSATITVITVTAIFWTIFRNRNLIKRSED